MTKCTIPPEGWECSREPGHEGPCAARPVYPWEKYADSVIEKLYDEDEGSTWSYGALQYKDMRPILIEAWMSGLEHSLELMKEVKGEKHGGI